VRKSDQLSTHTYGNVLFLAYAAT